jgi:hypothetical protein
VRIKDLEGAAVCTKRRLGLVIKEILEIRGLLPFAVSHNKIFKILGSKVPNLGHFEELSNLYCGQICVGKSLRFGYFKLPFMPNFVSQREF